MMSSTRDDPEKACQPFTQFVLKVHSRCDLACDYCYVYTMADQRWRGRPRVMSPLVIEQTAARVAEHARDHALPTVDVVLHGGEPLLAGPEVLTRLVRSVRAALPGATQVRFGVQTNGVRLDEGYLRTLRALRVSVSVSLDGGRVAHDRHRRRPDGGGSHDLVDAALRRLTGPAHRGLFAGLLCTVDLRNDPVETYRALAAYDPPMVDLLLPHGTWTVPPPGRTADPTRAPYGEWLIAVFDHWYRLDPPGPRVRMFEEILSGLLGGGSRLESIGNAPLGSVVVETDGAIEAGDTVNSAQEGAADTGLHVASDPFDRALALPMVRERQAGPAALHAQCRGCDLLDACGGGLYAHRYRQGEGFRAPSVYCPDLYRLIGHIRRVLARDLAQATERAR